MTAPVTNAGDRLLRLPEVSTIVGLGRTAIYKHIRVGTFPRPFKPGGFASRWSEREVLAWIKQPWIERHGAGPTRAGKAVRP